MVRSLPAPEDEILCAAEIKSTRTIVKEALTSVTTDSQSGAPERSFHHRGRRGRSLRQAQTLREGAPACGLGDANRVAALGAIPDTVFTMKSMKDMKNPDSVPSWIPGFPRQPRSQALSRGERGNPGSQEGGKPTERRRCDAILGTGDALNDNDTVRSGGSGGRTKGNGRRRKVRHREPQPRFTTVFDSLRLYERRGGHRGLQTATTPRAEAQGREGGGESVGVASSAVKWKRVRALKAGAHAKARRRKGLR